MSVKKRLKNFFAPIIQLWKVRLVHRRYENTLLRLRREYGKRKLRVGFLVSEEAKWKGQSVYDLMQSSDKFVPIILVYPTKAEMKKSIAIQKQSVDAMMEFFRCHEMEVENIWDYEKQRHVPLEQIEVDILFYQQTWDLPPAPSPAKVASRALTFYFPYYLVNYYIPKIETQMRLQHYVYRYIVFSQQQVDLYERTTEKSHYAGRFVGLGHPIADLFQTQTRQSKPSSKNYVIYAPHFSFPVPNKERVFGVSTFLDSGRVMLEFAKAHPEINWVFKPHPRLRRELVDKRVWTKEEVDVYYAEWENIGESCYTSDYVELFMESKAMITDCGSFLTEYSCTGKPLIHLVPGKLPAQPNPALEKLYGLFYEAPDNETLLKWLNQIVIKGEDPRREERLKCAEESGLRNSHAAQNIVNYIDQLMTA